MFFEVHVVICRYEMIVTFELVVCFTLLLELKLPALNSIFYVSSLNGESSVIDVYQYLCDLV